MFCPRDQAPPWPLPPCLLALPRKSTEDRFRPVSGSHLSVSSIAVRISCRTSPFHLHELPNASANESSCARSSVRLPPSRSSTGSSPPIPRCFSSLPAACRASSSSRFSCGASAGNALSWRAASHSPSFTRADSPSNTSFSRALTTNPPCRRRHSSSKWRPLFSAASSDSPSPVYKSPVQPLPQPARRVVVIAQASAVPA